MQRTEFSKIQNQINDYSEFGRLNASIFYQTYPLKEDVQTLQDQKINDFLQKLDNMLKKAPQSQAKQILKNLISSCRAYLNEKTASNKNAFQRNLVLLFDYVIKKTEELKVQIKETLIENGVKPTIGIFLYNALSIINETHGFFREIIEKDYSIESKLLEKLVDRYLSVWKLISAIKEETLDAVTDSQMRLNKVLRETRAMIGIKSITSFDRETEVVANAVIGHS